MEFNWFLVQKYEFKMEIQFYCWNFAKISTTISSSLYSIAEYMFRVVYFTWINLKKERKCGLFLKKWLSTRVFNFTFSRVVHIVYGSLWFIHMCLILKFYSIKHDVWEKDAKKSNIVNIIVFFSVCLAK